VGDLDSYLRRATDALHAAVHDARQSSDELRRILPALHAANSTPPPVPQEKVIALELKITPTEDRSARQSRGPSILDAWPEPQGPSDREN
jgi:hypothetical protein